MMRARLARAITRWAGAHRPLDDVTPGDAIAEAAESLLADPTERAATLNAWTWEQARWWDEAGRGQA